MLKKIAKRILAKEIKEKNEAIENLTEDNYKLYIICQEHREKIEKLKQQIKSLKNNTQYWR